jgi:NADP-dependent 3-hydroxy acid dehydrogenase YdfG
MATDTETRVVVITGASGGIGAALARHLGRQGYGLVLGARRQRELDRMAAEAQERGARKAAAVVTDVTRRDDVARLRDAAFDAFGQVDAWVNNAGRGISRPVLELTDADFDEMMAVNVKSALYGMQAIVPHFLARGEGHVINVSSFLGRVPFVTRRSAYNAAKAALNMLTANLRVDLARYPKVHVSLVMPGVVMTEFARHALGAAPDATPTAGSMKAQSPEEVAEVIGRLIEHPAAEVYTNPALHDVAKRYYEDVGGFEAQAAGQAGRR